MKDKITINDNCEAQACDSFEELDSEVSEMMKDQDLQRLNISCLFSKAIYPQLTAAFVVLEDSDGPVHPKDVDTEKGQGHLMSVGHFLATENLVEIAAVISFLKCTGKYDQVVASTRAASQEIQKEKRHSSKVVPLKPLVH